MTGERIIVVGAGIAGLSAAFRLKQSGFRVKVLEGDGHVGGRMSTIEKDGFLIDTGASLLARSYTEMLRLIRDAGLEDDVIPTSDIVGVVRDGQVHRVRNSSALDKLRGRTISRRAQLRMMKGFISAHRSRQRYLSNYGLSKAHVLDTENLEDYARRVFGEEALEYVVEPVCSGFFLVSAPDVSKVAFLWTLPNFYSGSFFNSVQGTAFLPRGLARQLDVTCGAWVSNVETRPGGSVAVTWTQEGAGSEQIEEADGVVLALNGHQMLDVYPQIDPVQREVVSRMRFAKSMHVQLMLDRVPDEKSVMVCFPNREHRLSNIILDYNKAPGRCPEGKAMFTNFFYQDWSEKRWHLSDEDVTEDAVAGVLEAMPKLFNAEDVIGSNVNRRDPCVLIPHPGVYRDMHRFEMAHDEGSPVQFAGDYFAVCTTNASLCSGERAAERIARRFGTTLGLNIPG